jgi:hypothetical protein
MEGRTVKRILFVAMIVSIPLMLFVATAQGARYHAMVVELRRLESVQADWIEENRRLLADIAIAKSRSRIDASMAGVSGYRMVNPKSTLRIRVEPGLEKPDG